MRRLLLTLLALSFATLSFAERLPRSERYALEGKENNIFLTLSTGLTDGTIGPQTRLEYNRQLSGNWFWGISAKKSSASAHRLDFGYDEGYYDYDTEEYHEGGCTSSSYSIDKNMISVNAMAYYRIPIIRDRLMLRPAFGIGVCYLSKVADDYTASCYNSENYMLNYTAELAWILRVSKHFELKFSPLVIPPFSFLPESASYCRSLTSRDDSGSFDLLLNLGLGIRF